MFQSHTVNVYILYAYLYVLCYRGAGKDLPTSSPHGLTSRMILDFAIGPGSRDRGEKEKKKRRRRRRQKGCKSWKKHHAMETLKQ